MSPLLGHRPSLWIILPCQESTGKSIIHTYHSRLILEGVAEASLIFRREAHVLQELKMKSTIKSIKKISIIHKVGLWPSSGDINRLIMMKTTLYYLVTPNRFFAITPLSRNNFKAFWKFIFRVPKFRIFWEAYLGKPSTLPLFTC
jgi:hypothetical protein